MESECNGATLAGPIEQNITVLTLIICRAPLGAYWIRTVDKCQDDGHALLPNSTQTSSHQKGKSETDDDSDDDDDDGRTIAKMEPSTQSLVETQSPTLLLLLLTPLLESLQLPRTREVGAKTMMMLMMMLELHNCKMEPKAL